MTISKVEQIRDLLKSIETGEPGPVAVVNEAKYIQHNPQTHEGSLGLAKLFKQLSLTNPTVNMVRGFEDGDYVFAQMEYDFSSAKICFEVFRFEDGRTVEHWDNLQERQPPNASGRSMVDGSTELTDLHLTEANRAHVRAFIETALIARDPDQIATYIDAANYAEHNPFMSDDLTTLRTTFADPAKAVSYKVLHKVLAQGNFVMTMVEGTQNGAPCAFYDLFRLKDGMIVEHWDTTATIAPISEWKNQNGKF